MTAGTNLHLQVAHHPGESVKVAVVSDLHHGEVYGDCVRRLAEDLRTRKPDVVAIAGDVGESPELFAEALGLFVGPWPLLVIVGNHDLWSDRLREIAVAEFQQRPPDLARPTSDQL